MNYRHVKQTLVLLVVIPTLIFSLVTVVSAAESRDALINRARQLSWDKKYEESIVTYKKLLKRNPSDVEAMIGLAAVTAWSGDHKRAVNLYKKVLKKDPKNKEALLGLSRVYFWMKNYGSSLQVLDELIEVYPGDREGLELKEKIDKAKQSIKHFKMRGGFEYQDISFTSNAPGVNYLFSYQEPQKWEVRAGFKYINKFGDSAPGYTVGGSYWAAKNTILLLDIDLAPKQVVVPRQAYTAGVNQRLFKGLVAGFYYGFKDYQASDSHIITPELTWYLFPTVNWMARYYLTISLISGRSFYDHSAMTKLTVNLVKPLKLFGGYAYASESFDSGSPVNPFGEFWAGHVFAGFDFEFYKGMGVDFTYDYEQRDNNFTIRTANVGLYYNW